MALVGQGFFMIDSPGMGEIFTRNGQFSVDSEMNLVLPGIGPVLDDGGSPITLENAAITVDEEGAIRYVDGDGEEVARIGVYVFEDMSELEEADRGFFRSEQAPDTATPGTYRIEQYMIEKSNVNMAMEMSRVIAGQNLYNACTQVVKMYDMLNETLVTQIGRVS
jgi:flagellar basal body rod protein FlgG